MHPAKLRQPPARHGTLASSSIHGRSRNVTNLDEGTPPGSNSGSSRCSLLTVSVRAWPSPSRRSAKSRSATVAPSAATTCSPWVRSATTATGSASVASVLRPWPVANTRARAGRLRRHIDHGLTVSDEPLGNMPANAAAAPGRPHAVREPAACGQHRLVTVAVSAEPALRQNPLAAVDDLDRRGPLMRVHPDDHMSHDSLSSLGGQLPARRAALLRAGQAPLEPLRATAAGGMHANVRATPTHGGQPDERASRRSPQPSLARHRP